MIAWLRRFATAAETTTKALAKSIKARVVGDNEKLKPNEITKRNVAYEVPSDVDPDSVYIGDDLSQFEEIAVMESITDKENKIKENDPSDDYIDYSDGGYRKAKKPAPVLPKYPDSFRRAIYPGGKNSTIDTALGKKPSIQMIKQWVEDVKLAGKSQRALEQEYNKMYEQDSIPSGWDNKKMDNLINSIAYAVARKIWYVGRKPSSMSDVEWDNDTKHMRPDDQTFDAGKKYTFGERIFIHKEEWGDGDNPYVGEEYTYTSGDPDERGRMQ